MLAAKLGYAFCTITKPVFRTVEADQEDGYRNSESPRFDLNSNPLNVLLKTTFSSRAHY